MTLAPRLDLRQSQSLVMTPQLQQAIKLLALSNLELEAFIGEEIEKNPLLETGGSDDSPGPDSAPDTQSEAAAPPDMDSAGVDQLLAAGDSTADAPLDADFANDVFIGDSASDAARTDSDPRYGQEGGSGGSDMSGDAIDLDGFASAAIGLHEHLMQQAGATLSGRDLMIAGHIIAQIDEAGYLETDLRDIAYQLGIGTGSIERVLRHVQRFDPSGVGARSLSECLAIQAREADRYDPAMARLIDNLELLARGALPHLRRICGVDDEDLRDMIAELRAYDPKPGLQFASDLAPAVVPDIFVRTTATGWAVEVNGATLPRLLVNRRYYKELCTGPQNKASKAWLSDCLASASWLIKALDQRQRTILRVAEEIVRLQEGFFRDGVTHLRPLTLKTIGDAIGMHESTVSRVTSNKYLSCPRGTFELKYFFKSGVQSNDGGDGVSAEAVKSHIRDLIAAEAPDAILSDDSLVEILRGKGFDIARRTVAKYREAIGLGSSVQRRRQKAIAGKR